MSKTNSVKIIIGVDTHKDVHTAVAINEIGGPSWDAGNPRKPQRLPGSRNLGAGVRCDLCLWH
jgi:hypothetical protein